MWRSRKTHVRVDGDRLVKPKSIRPEIWRNSIGLVKAGASPAIHYFNAVHLIRLGGIYENNNRRRKLKN